MVVLIFMSSLVMLYYYVNLCHHHVSVVYVNIHAIIVNVYVVIFIYVNVVC